MTTREFLNAVITANLSEDATAFATKALANLDAKNAKRASTPSKTAIANEPIKAAILAYLADNSLKDAATIGAGVGVSTPKASALLRQLAESGKVVAVKPSKSKSNVYSLVVAE